jgi:transposase
VFSGLVFLEADMLATQQPILHCQRNQVEGLINQLKQFPRIATRYEKRADNYLAMLNVAAIVLFLRFSNTS